MKKFKKIFSLCLMAYFSFFLICYSKLNEEEPAIKIHYLGHSAFVINFDNGINLVTDYGHYNIWVDSGWDSPIYSFGDLIPDIMTFSHFHPDHYDSTRIPEGVKYILSDHDSLEIDGIKIWPVRTCEGSIYTESNSSYIIEYKDLKLCHLGDAQAQIMAIENEEVTNRIIEIIPDSLDLLFMTIEGTEQFIPQAEIFIDLLKPKRVIPMHYWSNRYKRNFLLHLMGEKLKGKNYFIDENSASEFDIYLSEDPSPANVISLERSEYVQTSTNISNQSSIADFRLSNNYPNPFNPTTNFSYSVPHRCKVSLIIYDILGREVVTLANGDKDAGEYRIIFNAKDLTSGVYIYQMITDATTLSKKMMLIR